ncbi:MAG: InlB B-repeat-containing protein, partial [Candidatus Riflebacteria bacterium]|nr:InlB B-repeat-containing protein [Candidatus Riflebacteria bacterium]
MNKKLSIFTKLFVVSFFITLLFSCSFLENLYDDNSTEQDNDIAYLTLYDTSIARDIFPSEDDLDKTKLTNLTLKGRWQNGAEQTLIEEQTTWAAFINKFPFAVQTGMWDFTLTAKLNGVNFIGEITKKEILKSGSTTPLEFTLETETETCGGLSLTINVQNYSTAIPSGTTLTITTSLTDSSNEIKYNESKTYSGSSVTFESTIESKQLEAGIYDLEISLTVDGISQPITKHSGEKVYIYAGIITTSPLNLYVSPVYDIAYEYHDGELVTTGTTVPAKFSRKATVANLPELKKTGYNFLGWFTDDTDGTEVTEVSMSTINTSATTTTYYARFQTISYKITLENMTGASSDEIPANYNIESATITLPTPSKPGYNFEGWYTNEGLTTAAPESIPTGSTGDKTFYAKWTARTDTVYIVKHWKQQTYGVAGTHNTYNYELVAPEDTESKTGTTDTLVSFELKDTSTTNPADAFYGFKAPKEEEITAAQALTISGDGTLEVNLYYERQYVTVMYYKDSSTHIQSEKTSRYGQSFTVLATEPTKEGYTFTGWAIKANASETDTIYRVGTANNKYTLNSIETVKLYAQWQPITYTVTFNTNGGSSIDTQTVQHGKLAEQPKDAPTKEDYSFAGWYTDNKYTTEFNFAKTQITKNTTIYAKWVLDAHYAKIDGTYYNSYADAKDALTALSGGEHTIVFYSVDVAELGKTSDATGALFNIIANSHATAVHLIIHEDANLVFGSNNEAAFSCFNNLVSADLRGLKSAVTLGSMFDYCINLESVIFAEDFDTSNIIYADGMFYNCSKLTTLDLSMFDTSKIARMTKMFAGCSSLTTIYVSDKFVTTSVLGDYAGQVFSSCTSLVGGKGTSFSELGVIDATAAKIDGGTSNPGYFTLKPSSDSVTLTFNTMGGSSIASQILESGSYAIRPKTPSKSGYAFDGWYTDSACTTPFDFASPVTSDMTLYAKWVDRSGKFAKINDTFYEDFDSTMLAISKQLLYSGVKDITVTLYDSSLTASMLGNSASINTLLGAISNKDGSNNSVYDSVSLIFDAGAGIILGGAECMSLFQECQSLVYVDLSGIITKSLSDMGGMFKACQKLETVIFGDHFDTSKVGNMGEMFYHDLKLSHVDFGNLDTRNVQYMCSMLQECSSLTEIDISSFEPSSIKDISYMFADCINLKTIYASSKFVIPDKATDTAMFGNCTSLVGEKGTAYDSKYIGKELAQLDGGPTSSTPGYFSKKPSQSLNCSVGDVILVDGTVIPYTESMELNSEQQATAIAVI